MEPRPHHSIRLRKYPFRTQSQPCMREVGTLCCTYFDPSSSQSICPLFILLLSWYISCLFLTSSSFPNMISAPLVMMSSFTSLTILLLSSLLLSAEASRAKGALVPQVIDDRSTYQGGWSLGIPGISCPSDAPVKCVDGDNPQCCPSGQTCFKDVGTSWFCCPTGTSPQLPLIFSTDSLQIMIARL